jgi:hypothetical protein
VARKPHLPERRSSRRLLWRALLTWPVVVAAFLAIYPIVNTHVPGAGSDDDDALNLGRRLDHRGIATARRRRCRVRESTDTGHRAPVVTIQRWTRRECVMTIGEGRSAGLR